VRSAAVPRRRNPCASRGCRPCHRGLKWGGFVLIGFYGYWAARFSGAPVPRALAQIALVGLIAAC
jgi:hypothetical protein